MLSVAEVIAPPASLPMTCGCTNAARGRDASVVLQLQHPTADGGATASTPVLSKIHATKTKKAGAAQPPHGRALMQSPAMQSGPASAGAARGRGWSATSGRRARRPSASVYHAPALVRLDFSDFISLRAQYCSC